MLILKVIQFKAKYYISFSELAFKFPDNLQKISTMQSRAYAPDLIAIVNHFF